MAAAEHETRENITDILESALRNNAYQVERVDHRTLLIKVRNEHGVPNYFQVLTKAMY